MPPRDDSFILRLTPKFTAVKEYARLLDREIESLASADAERLRCTDFEDEETQRIEEDEHDWLYKRVVPRSLRYSCIVALMTAVDTALIAICEELRQRREIALPPSALKGSDRKKAMVYLKKVVGVTPPSGWFASHLAHLGAIRNCIVHQDGHVDRVRKPEKLRTYIQAVRGFDATNGVITVAPGVCEKIADEAIEWLFDLADAAGLYRRRRE